MGSDFEIGRVVAVDTSQVTIELNPDLKALTRSTYETTIEVGRINSYVMIPVGARKIVAMITRVVMTEEAELRTDKTMVTLPSARRLMKATMIGTIDGEEFTQGISLFPVLDSPVLVVSGEDLEAIFGRKDGQEKRLDSDNPGYCIPIGKSAIFAEYDIRISPDIFFGKHAAVIGSTGSGKSCSIAAVIQSIIDFPDVKNTRFIILDTNGEYRAAFQREQEGGSWTDANPKSRCFHLPTDPTLPTDRLVIPYWFMNSDDFVRLFRASAGIQRPVLIDALRLARSPSLPHGDTAQLRQKLLRELHRLISRAEESGKTSAEVEDIAAGCRRFLEGKEESLQRLFECGGEELVGALDQIKDDARRYVGQPDAQRFPKILPLDVKESIKTCLQPCLDELMRVEGLEDLPEASPDSPLFFGKSEFRHDYLERAMQRDEAGGARARDYCATMLMRIYRLLEDKRFEFLFGPVEGEWPKPLHSLATFIRDLLGLTSGDEALTPIDEIREELLPFYDRQRKGLTKSYNVVVVDLSLLASEILENVTALIGRLILEFLQRAGDKEVSGIERGQFPVVLVLEEAQNYVRESIGKDDESISKEVYERIAREGRKYGLGLVVASQRPSELSRTVLSQCNSFIVHRLQNPEDLRYFREIVPGIYNQLLDQLPALAPRNALVLGECVRAPALVYMREANPIPRSKDPKFYEQWVSGSPSMPKVEAICQKWEGKVEKKQQVEQVESDNCDLGQPED